MFASLNSVFSLILLYSAERWSLIYRVKIEVLYEPFLDSLLNTP